MRREIRLRVEKKEELDVQRFARALYGLMVAERERAALDAVGPENGDALPMSVDVEDVSGPASDVEVAS